VGTNYQRSTRGISLSFLSLFVSSYKAIATGTFTTGIAGIDPTGDDTSIVGFIFCIRENAPFHPECSFAIASSAILPFGRFKIPEVLKDEYACSVLLDKLDNTSAHQVGYLLIGVADLTPQIGIIPFVLCNDASLATVTGDPSELFLPKAIYPSTTMNECGSENRTFNRSDSAHCEMFIDIEIN
jgi:hypothetical protein